MKALKLKRIYQTGMAVLMIGIAVLLYPPLSALWTDHAQKKDATEYAAESKTMPDEEKERQLREAESYNTKLFQTGTTVENAFRFDAAERSDVEYQEMLNLTEIMATIEIPAIDLRLPVYHGVSDTVLQKGVGHVSSTSLPVGGKGTHCILMAHSGIQSRTLFTNLYLLEPGDMIAVTVYNRTIYYEVQEKEVVMPSEINKLQIKKDEDRLTLITCTHYGVNSHRLLVHALRFFPAQGEKKSAATFIKEQKQNVFTVINGIEAVLVLTAAAWWVRLFVHYKRIRRAIRLRRIYEAYEGSPPEKEKTKKDRNRPCADRYPDRSISLDQRFVGLHPK